MNHVFSANEEEENEEFDKNDYCNTYLRSK